jgi:hypothetical protein
MVFLDIIHRSSNNYLKYLQFFWELLFFHLKYLDYVISNVLKEKSYLICLKLLMNVFYHLLYPSRVFYLKK